MSFYGLPEEKMMTLPEPIRDYDWYEAFSYAPFGIFDVSDVVAVANGANDGDNWVGVFRLKDGRYGYVSAGCDYTGWDCQAGGSGEIRDNLQDLVRECCGDDDRARLGLVLSGVTS